MLQRSPEWWAARCGKCTASRVGDVIATTRNGWGAARGKYLEQLVCERLTGRNQDNKVIRSLEARAELEPEARAAYSFYTDNDIELVGFVEHPKIVNSGASEIEGQTVPLQGMAVRDGAISACSVNGLTRAHPHDGTT